MTTLAQGRAKVLDDQGWPPPGSFGLSVIGGWVGKLVWAGQLLSGDGSKWTHAFLVLDNWEVIEARPGGAALLPLEKYLKHKEILFCDLPIRKATRYIASPEEKAAEVLHLRKDLNRIGRSLVGVRYNWLNYPALGLLALGWKPEWLRRFVRRASTGMICSQLVDYCYAQANVHLFNDKREPMDVTPGDLARWVVNAEKAFRSRGGAAGEAVKKL